MTWMWSLVASANTRRRGRTKRDKTTAGSSLSRDTNLKAFPDTLEINAGSHYAKPQFKVLILVSRAIKMR